MKPKLYFADVLRIDCSPFRPQGIYFIKEIICCCKSMGQVQNVEDSSVRPTPIL